jgi:glycosyltransferase involved in cell wall biosynthesis
VNILIVSDSYPPEIRSASHLMQEMAEELRDRGHIVTVATCYPKYNLANTFTAQEYKEVTVEDEIRVIRIHTLPHHKVNFILRGVSQLTLPYIFWFVLKKYLTMMVDAIVVYSPPLPLWRVGYFAKKTFGARFILNVQDIFPQNAIDLGVLTQPFLIRFFEKMEQRAYDTADIVTVHSPGNATYLLGEKKIAPSRLAVLHNWVDVGSNQYPQKRGHFRKKLDLEQAFIIFFGGVMGPSQGLDLILDAAKCCLANHHITFLLVGDGVEKERLVKRAREENLMNILFHPFVSKEDYDSLLKEVDVGLVCLSPKNKTPVVPGKILSYMATGVPILAFLNHESDGHKIINEARCGHTGVSDDPHRASQLILKMFQEKDQLGEMGLRGYQYALQDFSKKMCMDKLERLLHT